MSDLRKYVSIDPTRLTASISGSATSFTVAAIQDATGTALSTSDIGTENYGVFEPGTDNFELFTWSTFSGTTVTVTSRGIQPKQPYTASASLQKAHAAGAVVILYTDAPGLYDSFANKNNDETIAETWTFTETDMPRISASHTYGVGEEEFLATKRYADSVALSGAPDASTTQKGVAEEATQAEVEAGTAAGSAARLFINPSTLRAKRFHSFAADSGVSDAYAITVSPTISAYTDGDVFVFEAATANTGAATLNVSAVGAKTIKKYGSKDLNDNDIVAGSIVMVVYDADSDTMMLQTPVGKQQLSQSGTEINGGTSNAGTDAYVATLTPAITAYAAGQLVEFQTDVANTGAATLNVNGLGAQALKKFGSLDLSTGDLAAGMRVLAVNDGTNFQILSGLKQPVSVAVVPFPAAGAVAASTFNFASNTVAAVWAIVVNEDIIINKLSVNVATHTTNDTLDIALYSQDGQTQLFTITTATVTGTGVVTTAVSAFSLKAGTYYIAAVQNGVGAFTLDSWTAVVSGLNSGVGSEPVLIGTLTVTAGTLPSTITTTSITSSASAAFIVRFDN